MTALLPVLLLPPALLVGCTARRTPVSLPAASSQSTDPATAAAVSVKLRTELTRVLAARGIELDRQGRPLKRISSVPRRDYLTPVHLVANEDAMLGWRHSMLGDYDQNGEVNIADLTPIGMHLGKTSASPDWAVASCADGDANGEINIADVTPIGSNFAAICGGYVIEALDSADSSWREFGHVLFSSALKNGAYKDFEYTALGGAAESEFRVAPVGLSREFDWPTYQLTTGSSSRYLAPSICLIGGLPAVAYIDSFSHTLCYARAHVAHPLSAADWTLMSFEGLATAGYPALCEVDGLAAIAVSATSPTGDFLAYLRAKTPAPMEAADWVVLFPALDNAAPNSNVALVTQDGLPRIVYFKPGTGLRIGVIPVTQPDSTAGWSIVDTSNASVNWDFPSVAVIGGLLNFICAQPLDNEEIYFGRALNTNPLGPADFECYSLTQSPEWVWPRLAAVGGQPLVARSNTFANEVHIMYATAAKPVAAQWGEYTLDTYGNQPWLALLDGKPAAMYTVYGKAFAWAQAEQPLNAAHWLRSDVESLDGSLQGPAVPWLSSGGLPIAVSTFYDSQSSTYQLHISMAQEK